MDTTAEHSQVTKVECEEGTSQGDLAMQDSEDAGSGSAHPIDCATIHGQEETGRLNQGQSPTVTESGPDTQKACEEQVRTGVGQGDAEMIEPGRNDGGKAVESDEEEICRYCFEGKEDGELISPCRCTGGQKYVHLSCLRRWQVSAP